MSKELTAQKNFLFNGRVLGVGERFSTSVLHARDLVVSKLAVEVLEGARSKAKTASAATAPDSALAAGAETGTSSDDFLGQSTAADEGDNENNASDDTQDASTETGTSSDGSTPTDEDFDQMTTPQLKEVLNEIGVQFAARASKSELLELVKESFGEDPDATADQESSPH